MKKHNTQILADLGHNWAGNTEKTTAKRGIQLIEDAAKAGVDGVVINLFNSYEVFRDVEVAKNNKRFNMGDNIFDTLVDSARSNNLDVYVGIHYYDAIDMVDLNKIKGFYLSNGVLVHDGIINGLSPIVNNSSKVLMVETGIFSLEDIEFPLKLFDPKKTVILHSSGVYPTKDMDLRLNLIGDLIFQLDPQFEKGYLFGYASTALTKEMDFVPLSFILDAFVRKIDLEDGHGIESSYSVTWKHLEKIVNFSDGIYSAMRPLYVYDNLPFTQNDINHRNRWLRDPDDLKTPCRCGNAQPIKR